MGDPVAKNLNLMKNYMQKFSSCQTREEVKGSLIK